MDSDLKKKYRFHEDWIAVFIGFLIIGISLSGSQIESPSLKWSTTRDLTHTILSTSNLKVLIIQFSYLIGFGSLSVFLVGKPIKKFLLGFPLVYFITLIALFLAGNTTIKALGLEAVIFSLILGLLFGNFFKLPDFLRASLSTELFVKIGLVLLGSSVVFSDILQAGFLGLIQAVIVVFSVWYFAFWVCKKLKVDKELALMISSAVSICGVSAAIATSGAIKGDSKKLSYVISMVLVTAIPMMIFMPLIANYFHFGQELTGAWIGGSIDTSGAVVASGSMVGEVALKISTIVKFSQNVLLGIAAFAISIYWSYSQELSSSRPSLKLIWERFPKFVIGFVLASLLFSFVITPEYREGVKEGIKNLQGLWFALAFSSIGLETNFRELLNKNSKKPLYGFLIAQLFNVLITLFVAFLIFGS